MHVSIGNRPWRLEDVSLRLLAGLLVLAVVGFAIFYTVDRRVDPGPAPLDNQIDWAEGAVKEDPNALQPRLVLAEAYYVAGRFRDSASQYEAALVIDDKSMLASWGLGRALLKTGDSAGAATSFQKIVQASENSDIRGDLLGGAYYFLAQIALDDKRVDDAIALARNAVLIDRADADALQLLGAAYVAKGSYDQALPLLLRAVTFVPDFAEAYEQMAIAYDAKGMKTEARYARAMKSYSQGDYAKAEKELNAVVSSDHKYADAFVGLGLTYEKQGKKDKAGTAYLQALEIQSDNFNARNGALRVGALKPGAGSQEAPHGSQPGAPTGGGQ